MRTGTAPRRTPDDDRTERRWRLGFFIILSCAALIALMGFAEEPPNEMAIRPSGPLPAVNIP